MELIFFINSAIVFNPSLRVKLAVWFLIYEKILALCFLSSQLKYSKRLQLYGFYSSRRTEGLMHCSFQIYYVQF